MEKRHFHGRICFDVKMISKEYVYVYARRMYISLDSGDCVHALRILRVSLHHDAFKVKTSRRFRSVGRLAQPTGRKSKQSLAFRRPPETAGGSA